jgi:hypothetical protein
MHVVYTQVALDGTTSLKAKQYAETDNEGKDSYSKDDI